MVGNKDKDLDIKREKGERECMKNGKKREEQVGRESSGTKERG